MNTEQQLKLQAFLDGELPENETREFLAWLQHDAEAASLLAELKNTRQALAKSEPALKVPESREFYWSKIQREIQALEPRASAAPDVSIFSRLHQWLLPASALAALLAAGVIVHFYAPTTVIQNVADADTPTVETTLASADATTYRDAGSGTTLVWFSDDASAKGKKPTAIN